MIKHKNQNFQKIIALIALVPVCIGLLTMFGWIVGSSLLVQIFPSLVPMQFNTALGFVTSGLAVSYFLYREYLPDERLSIGARLCALWCASIGFLTLIQYIFGINLGIDELFIEHEITTLSPSPGRMAPVTALCFTIIGAKLLLSYYTEAVRSFRGLVGATVIGLALGGLISYFFGFDDQWFSIMMRQALHTALGFILLGSVLVAHSFHAFGVKRHDRLAMLTILVFIIGLFFWVVNWQANDEVVPETMAFALVLGAGILAVVLLYTTSMLALNYRSLRFAEQVNDAQAIFFSRVSHDLRTPINSILGYSEAMLTQQLGNMTDERRDEYLKNIYESGRYLLELVNNILDISKIESEEWRLDVQAIDKNEIAAKTIALVQQSATNKGVTLELVKDHEGGEMLGDYQSIYRILINLVANAIEYTPEGKKVSVFCYRSGGFHIFEVSDGGRGIPEDKRKYILEPYKQLPARLNGFHYSGTGLGLSIVKALVDIYGGHIDILSNDEGGARFIVSIPEPEALTARE